MTTENQKVVNLAGEKSLPDALDTLKAAAIWWDTVDDFFGQIASGTPNKVDDFVVKFIGLVLPPAAETAMHIKSIAEIIKITESPEKKAILIQDALASIGEGTKNIQVFFLTLLMKSIND